MNNNNMPFKKRSNPIDTMTVKTEEETPVAPVVKQVVKEQPVYQQKPVAQDDSNRLKYTATMDKNLHKRLKVAAAMSGFQISAFIEEALLEKLNREGL